MFNIISKERLQSLRNEYTKGTRVQLISMNYPFTKLTSGDRGTVEYVDDVGTVFVRWDNGSGLGLAYGEDSYRKLTDEELKGEQK